MLVETLAVGPFQCNCTILASEEGKQAIVVDPGGDHDRILEIVRHHGLEVVALVHTHAHLDHIASTREVKEATGAAIRLHPGDEWLYENYSMQAALFGWRPKEMAPIDGALAHDEVIPFGDRTMRVIHTPGHTPGSVCFDLADEALLLAGDTLFARSIGRTDLWGGSMPDILSSIRGRLFALDDDTRVICGHGPDTTIGAEKRHNPFLQDLR